MKKYFIIAFVLLFVQLQAQVRIDEREAFSTAEKFLQENAKLHSSTLSLSEKINSKHSGLVNLYVFSVEPQGFVIVSALNDVLAYSLVSPMPASEILPDHIRYWLNLYNEATDHLIEHPEHRKKPTKTQAIVEPLLTSYWGQGCYYNEACPFDISGPCFHVEAGCVAIAMAQIMYYHKYPLKGNGEMTYPCSPYGTLTANFGHTIYQWDQMADTLQESNPYIAKLVSHCGISVMMQYSPNGSSAFCQDAFDALRKYFFYSSAIFSRRDSYSDEEWQQMIKNDLDQRYPVFYAGNSSQGGIGHAFVCDGYNNNGMFHFNFGWNGVADGYYDINNPYGISNNQCVIRNIVPSNALPIQSDEHGIIYVDQEGTGDGSSWENATSDLQAAIYKSHTDKSTIWVKEGTYTRASADEYAFNLFGDCLLHGGFKGDEPYDYDLSLRDFEAHPSILDGNHSRGVLRMQLASHPVLIDGFTVKNGKASQGGGILVECQTHIKNCKFLSNFSNSVGGGLSQQSTSSSKVIIEDCEFFGNEARSYGGAVYDLGNTRYLHCVFCDNLSHSNGGGVYCNATNGPSQFTGCTISNNQAAKGGGVATKNQGTTFWSCLISNNTASTGGGCYLRAGTYLYNCTIVKNEAQTDYGGVYAAPPSSQNGIRNCIIWGNISAGENAQIGPPGTYSYCAVEDAILDENHNFNADTDNDGGLPNFYIRFQNANVVAGIAGQGGDWHLQPNSLCIDRVSGVSNQPSTDLDGHPRHQHNKVDLGAYETDVTAHVIDAYFCEDSPYYYQDSLLSELGFYTFLHQNNAYDSLVIVQMQEPTPPVFITKEICDNDTYDFFGTLLNEPGTYTTTNQCITYNLTLKTKPSTVVNMQEEICGGETFDFFGEQLQETGHYSTTIDCKTYELDLTVDSASYNPVFTEAEICEGETYVFCGRHLKSEGHYFASVNCVKYELDLTVYLRPSLQCSNDTLVEYGNPIQLSASGANSYLWSTGDTTQYITVTPVADQNYTVRGFSKNGCSNTASVNVRIKLDTDEMALFPNPANDEIEIYMPLIDEVEVFNLLGICMDKVTAEREAVKLNVSAYPVGVYVVHVRHLGKHHYKKLIIQR